MFYAIQKTAPYQPVTEFQTRQERDEFCATAGRPRWSESHQAHWQGNGEYAEPIRANTPEVRKFKSAALQPA
ncbi:MAG: hypothetical protein EOP87_00105 [Verrucomicrobiaceae bacterium]|nr:MAG: hypothetical protein EOP87_00105 [Verrucomicrobiaceae bacterium]